MVEPLYQGSKDVFLAKVRADFDAIEDQALKSSRALSDWSLVGTDANLPSLFTMVSNVTSEGDRAVWRDVSTSGIKGLGTRKAGDIYPESEFIRGYETAVYDPDQQNAGEFIVPEEREAKEGTKYKAMLNRAQKLLYEIDRLNVADIFEVFNLGFTVPTSYPVRFFAKGTNGLDGNNTALNEYLISIQHARADAGTTISNAVQVSGNAAAFTDVNYWAAREQGATFLDDVGKRMPMFGGKIDIIVPPANNLVRVAMEINGSEWKTTVNNNDINVQEGLFSSVKSSPYLLSSSYLSGVANTKAWFLVDSSVRDPMVGNGFIKISFVPLSTRVQDVEAIDSIRYKVKQEYVYGWTDWRNTIGSKGDGTAYSN